MSLFERRQRVERVLVAAAHPDRMKARQTVSQLMDDHAHADSRELNILLAAVTLALGGRLELPYGVLGQVPPGGGIVLEDDLRAGVMRISTHHDLGTALGAAILAADDHAAVAPAAPEPPPAAPIATDYPPANPDEPEGVAKARICNAFRTLVHRHYDGEVRARGFGFMETVAGELLAMALGIRLAAAAEPEAPLVALHRIAQEIVPRVLAYQHAIEQVQDQHAVEPGDTPPPAPNPSSLH